MKPWVRFSVQVVGLILWTAIAVTQRTPVPERRDGQAVGIRSEQDGGRKVFGDGSLQERAAGIPLLPGAGK